MKVFLDSCRRRGALVLCLTLALVMGQTSTAHAGTADFDAKNEVRAVWISYFELEPMLKNRSEAQFREAIGGAFKRLSSDKMNTVFVHVRPAGDALYASKLYPASFLMTGSEGAALTYDPLKVMLEEAKNNGLKFEAWINPYRVRNGTLKAPISKDSQADKWLNDGSGRVVKLENGIYYNPSDAQVNALVVKGVKEIVDNYKVDGIHFDDYFYPTTASSFDKKQYEAYVKAGGKLKLADFRRAQIDQMVKSVYQVCKAAKTPVRFGISPQGLIGNNYDQQYANVKKWASEKGYVDYLCPQLYYGLKNSKAGFEKTLAEWDALSKKGHAEVYIGLAAYKIGLEDKYAGTGKAEWQTDEQLLTKMVERSRTASKYKGFAIFRYDSLWKPAASVKAKVEAERKALLALLK